jgi:hypothetical protein
MPEMTQQVAVQAPKDDLERFAVALGFAEKGAVRVRGLLERPATTIGSSADTAKGTERTVTTTIRSAVSKPANAGTKDMATTKH